eukprot:scaffold1690_cov182-Amphora_coffeaeformis.AAC.63
MFKKTTASKKPKAIRRRAVDSEEDDDHDNHAVTAADDDEKGTTTTTRIQETRKKRKLWNAVQYKRGVNATELLLVHPDPSTTRSGRGVHDRAGGTATPAVKTAAETSRDGALERKHREAMEAFIEERITGGKDKKSATSLLSKDEAVQQSSSSATKPLTEEALYMELAAQSALLAGKPLQPQDGDEEERGAVLVAGTGIAEVILPVTERLKVAQETELAKNSSSRRAQRGPTGPSAPLSTIPNRFAVASTMSHSEFNRQYGRDSVAPASAFQSNNNNEYASTPAERRESSSTADAARPGFEATRPSHRPGAAHPGATSRRDQASDHKVFSKFVTRQRELRK